MPAQVAHLLTDQHEIACGALVNAAFARDDLGLHLRWRIVKFDRDEALPRRLLQILQDRLVTGIVRNYQHEIRRRFDDRAELLDRQTTTVIGQRVNDHNRVFTSFDNFVEITDCAVAHSGCQRTVVPDRLLAFEQKTPYEVRRR